MKEICETCQCGLFMFHSCLFIFHSFLSKIATQLNERYMSLPIFKYSNSACAGKTSCRQATKKIKKVNVGPPLLWRGPWPPVILISHDCRKPSFWWPKMFHPRLLIIIRAPTNKPALFIRDPDLMALILYMISIYHNLFSCIYMYTVAVVLGPKGCVGLCGTCEGPFDRPHDSPRWHHRTTCVCQLSSSIQGNMWNMIYTDKWHICKI